MTHCSSSKIPAHSKEKIYAVLHKQLDVLYQKIDPMDQSADSSLSCIERIVKIMHSLE